MAAEPSVEYNHQNKGMTAHAIAGISVKPHQAHDSNQKLQEEPPPTDIWAIADEESGWNQTVKTQYITAYGWRNCSGMICRRKVIALSYDPETVVKTKRKKKKKTFNDEKLSSDLNWRQRFGLVHLLSVDPN